MPRKCLLVVVDGMRPDSLSTSPIAEKWKKEYTYVSNAQTVFPSVTFPTHMSLFHSVDPQRHNNLTNTYVPQVRPVRGLCEVLRAAGKTCAFFYNWEELRDLARPDSLTYSCFASGHTPGGYEKAIQISTRQAMECIAAEAPDFVFLYLGMVDEEGHAYGWMTEEYLRAVRLSWEMIDKVCQKLPEEYDVFVTADHGGHDRTHGTEMPEDMTIPFFWKGENVPASLENVSIKDIAPTIVARIGVAPDAQWEGKAL